MGQGQKLTLRVVLLVWLFVDTSLLSFALATMFCFIPFGYWIFNNSSYSSLNKFRAILFNMERIRNEIAGESYDPQRVAEKLKDIEKKGGYVYSIAYSLLNLMCELSKAGDSDSRELANFNWRTK